MSKDELKDNLDGILPDSLSGVNSLMFSDRSETLEGAADKHIEDQALKQVRREKRRAKQALAREAQRAEAGIPEGRTAIQHARITALEKQVEDAEAIEAAVSPGMSLVESINNSPSRLASRNIVEVQGATKGDVGRLFASIGLNTNFGMSKKDTRDMVASLLLCNENQLIAIASNPKVPVAVKTIIKSLLNDMKYGNTETVDKLWDRVFGRDISAQADAQQAQAQGAIPNAPISREAYIILRDTLIK